MDKELALGILIEDSTPALLRVDPPNPIWRLNNNGRRWYFTLIDNVPKLYASVTTFIKQSLPQAPQLMKWIADVGYDESRAIMEEKAHYGTFMHIQIAELLIKREYDLDKLRIRMLQYAKEHNIPDSFVEQSKEMAKDILAFAQFAKDCEVEPLAIEIVLYHPEDGYAGAIDLVCKMTVEESGYFGEVYKTGEQKGQPKLTKGKVEVRAIVDFKSGRKGFYESHEIQLQAYKEMWDIHFPTMPINRLYNWSPKDWRDRPSYNLTDQTNKKSLRKLPYLVAIAKLENKGAEEMTSMFFKGNISLDSDFTENITNQSLIDIIMGAKITNDAELTDKGTENN
jgi:hypothetical protein